MGKVFVAGSMNMDVVAFSPRLPAPGETILGSQIGFFPGGKGLNPSVAAARMGAEVELIACLGNDAFGSELEQFAATNRVGQAYRVRDAEAPTGTAVILVSESGGNQIVVVPGANGRLEPRHVAAPGFPSGSVLLSLFEIPLATVRAFLEKGRDSGALTILSPSPAAECDFLDLPDVLVLNETELAFYLGQTGAPSLAAEVAPAARQLIRRPEQTVIVTLGAQGAIAVGPGGEHRVFGRPVQAVDTTAAGDCFTGCLAARMADGATVADALRFANAAASICVTRAGAAPSMPTREEVDAVLAE